MSTTPGLELDFQDAFGSPAGKLPPLYKTSQDIVGSLRITGCHTSDFVVKLTFCGNMFNRISFPGSNYIKPPDLSLNQITYECAIVHRSGSSPMFEHDGPDSRTMPFRFPLDRRFLRGVDDIPGTDELFPPSLRVNSLKYGERGVYCQVSYTVKATLVRDGMKPITTTRDIRIVDETPAPSPPICVADFGAEYLCQQSKTLKNKLGLPQGRLSMTVCEPPPIQITDEVDRDMARIPLYLTFDGASSANIQKGWNVSIDWTLKASTFVSTVAMRSTPTLAQAQNSVFMRHAETTMNSGRRKTVLMGWRQATPKSSDSSTWALESSLWLDVIPKQLLPPTFTSHFLSRRYFISLQMRVAGEGSNVFELQFPVQINFPGPGGMDLRRRSSFSTLCSLPQYVK